jgi:hypothetical protein
LGTESFGFTRLGENGGEFGPNLGGQRLLAETARHLPKQKRAAGILPAERGAIAQERNNHSPIRLTTMPLPAGRWQHAKQY